MEQKMTWEEMKKTFPDEWLLITDYEHNEMGQLRAGIVVRHSKEKQEVFRQPALDKDCAFKYSFLIIFFLNSPQVNDIQLSKT